MTYFHFEMIKALKKGLKSRFFTGFPNAIPKRLYKFRENK